jgi:hypothetical protein
MQGEGKEVSQEIMAEIMKGYGCGWDAGNYGERLRFGCWKGNS